MRFEELKEQQILLNTTHNEPYIVETITTTILHRHPYVVLKRIFKDPDLRTYFKYTKEEWNSAQAKTLTVIYKPK